jgi:predicted nucleotidyltransferase component of viral defense system
LAEFYLHHRRSEDIDLFSENSEVNQSVTGAFLKKISPKLNIKKIELSQFFGLFSYILTYTDNQKLKIDFNYYPFLRIEKGMKLGNLQIDSLIDIAANKVHTLFIKPRNRDYIDLFFIFKHGGMDLNQLILLAKAKFDWDIDKMNLANQFIRIKDIQKEDFPKVLVPFNTNEMEEFFLTLAKDLKKDILK